MSTARLLTDARNVKSTDCPGFGTVKLVVTGLKVPIGNGGLVTFAFDVTRGGGTAFICPSYEA